MAISLEKIMAKSHYASAMADDKPKGTTAQPGEKYIVRFPEGMRDRIAEAARANGRSMNAEIVARLESTFKEHDTMLEMARLHGALTGTKEAFAVVVDEATKQIFSLSSAGKKAQDLLDEYRKAFAEVVVLAQGLAQGSSVNTQEAQEHLDRFVAIGAKLESLTSAVKAPEVRPLADAIRAAMDKK